MTQVTLRGCCPLFLSDVVDGFRVQSPGVTRSAAAAPVAVDEG